MTNRNRFRDTEKKLVDTSGGRVGEVGVGKERWGRRLKGTSYYISNK